MKQQGIYAFIIILACKFNFNNKILIYNNSWNRDQSVKDIITNVVKLRESNWGVAPKPMLNPNAAVFRPTPKSNNSSNPTETAKFNPNASEFYPSYANSYKNNLSDQQEQPVRDIGNNSVLLIDIISQL